MLQGLSKKKSDKITETCFQRRFRLKKIDNVIKYKYCKQITMENKQTKKTEALCIARVLFETYYCENLDYLCFTQLI